MNNLRFRPRLQSVPGAMNKTEAAYAAHLELLKRAGEILDYRFEPLKLRLADKTYYSPDFLVITAHQAELHEVKGFMRDDAAVKLKVAAEAFPWFQFVLVKRASSSTWDTDRLS